MSSVLRFQEGKKFITAGSHHTGNGEVALNEINSEGRSDTLWRIILNSACINDFEYVAGKNLGYAVTSDGKLLSLKINHKEKGNEIFSTRNNTEISSLSIQRGGGEMICLGCKNGKIEIINNHHSIERSYFAGSSINKVEFQDTNIIVAASNKFVSTWDIRTNDIKPTLTTKYQTTYEFHSLGFSDDKSFIFSGTNRGSLFIFDQRNSMTPIAQDTPLHTSTIWDLRFYDKNLYSIGDDGAIIKTDFSSLGSNEKKVVSSYEYLENLATYLFLSFVRNNNYSSINIFLFDHIKKKKIVRSMLLI